MYHGVIDRNREGKAVILVEGKEFVIDENKLPGEVSEGDWLKLEFHNSEIVSVTLDREYTNSARNRIEEKHTRLKKRQKSKFRKDK